MASVFKNDWGETVERFTAFWKGEIVDRCCMAVIAPRDGVRVHQPEPLPEDPGHLRRSWLDPELNLRRMQPLLYDMLDHPDAVRNAIRRLADNWCRAHAYLYAIARPHTDGGCCVPWMKTWAPGPHCQMSCEFSAALSPGVVPCETCAK